MFSSEISPYIRVRAIYDGAIGLLRRIAEENELKNMYIFTGSGYTKRKLGPRLVRLLHDYLVPNHEEAIGIKDATEGYVRMVERVAKRSGAEVLVAAGGGKTIDTVKLAAHRLKLKWISTPTVLSHDGIASPRVSIVGDKEYSVKADLPEAVVIDLRIARRAPYNLTVAGFEDVVAKLSSVKNLTLAIKESKRLQAKYDKKTMGRIESLMIDKSALKLLEDVKQLEKKNLQLNSYHKFAKDAFIDLAESLLRCGFGMHIADSSQPASGPEHLWAHSVNHILRSRGLKPKIHGELVGVGTIASLYVLEDFFNTTAYEVTWKNFQQHLRYLGAPTNAEELGLSKKILIDALIDAAELGHKRRRFTYLEEISDRLTETLARGILRQSEIIQ